MNLLNTLATRLALAGFAALGMGFSTTAAAQATVTLSGTLTNTCAYSTITTLPSGNVTVACTTTTVNPPVCPNPTYSASVGGNVTLVANCTNSPTSYSWTAGSGSPAITGSTTGSTASLTGLAAGSYTYTVTATNSAGNSTGTHSVTVAAPTAAPACTALTPGSANITTGSSTTLTASCDQGPTAYGWSVTGTGAPAVPAAGPTNPITVGPFTTAGTYTFSVVAANSVGTGTVIASTTITVTDPVAGCPTVATVASLYNNIINLRFNLKPGEIGSFPFDWPVAAYPDATKVRMFTVKATNLESPGGLQHTVTISPCQGQMSTTIPACTMTGGNGGFTFTVGAGTACTLTPGQRYYINVKQTTSAGANTCVPSGGGINYCSSVVQGTPL